MYRHPSMDIKEFNEDYFSNLMVIISTENKKVFLEGDFNIDLMKVESDEGVSNFLDTITLNLFVPHIIYPTRITIHSHTLINNIFSNTLNFSDGISGNLTISISDHLAQFLIIDEEFTKIPEKQNRLKRDTKNFDQENFILDLLNIDWPDIINIDQNDVNSSFNSFETTINALIEQYMPIKKMSKNEIKQLYKPWITNGIRNSIRRREKLYKKFIKAKNQEVKNEHHHNYKELRNQIVTIYADRAKIIIIKNISQIMLIMQETHGKVLKQQ